MKNHIISILFATAILLANTWFVTAQTKNESKIQIAILLDTSNSMDGLIDQAKAQLWKIVNELATARYEGERPSLEIALYEYGNDNLSGTEGHIRQLSPLTTDLDKISDELFKLSTYGGNEYCGWVIRTTTDQLTWSSSDKDLKIIFIAGNEPFNQGSVDYKLSCKNAIGKSIIVNTIFCGPESEGIQSFWKDGADLADGKFMTINSDQKTVYIESPFDDKIIELNALLNQTYIAFGDEGEERKVMQEKQDNNAASYSKVNAAIRGVSKSSGVYSNTSWDLVDAYTEDKKVIDKVEDDELPAELKGKDKKEIEAYVTKKRDERIKIQKEIQDLNAQREKYVADKQKELALDNTLDAAMLGSIRKQAEKKNYSFVK